MFARKQKAFSIPTRSELNAMWLKARKQIGTSPTLQIAQSALSFRPAELSVKCYRSSTEPIWQIALHDSGEELNQILISSDLSAVSRWISESLTASTAARFAHDSGTIESAEEWHDNSLAEIDDDRDTVAISCAALFQALAAGRVTGSLNIENQVASGTVHWRRGEVVKAQWSRLSGSEALIQMILLKEGRYSFDSGMSLFGACSPKLSQIKSDVSLALDTVLLEAAYREAQLSALFEDQALGFLSAKRRESLFSQARINRNLTQICGHEHLVYCLELLRFMGSDELLLSALQSRVCLPFDVFVSATATLVSAGFIRVKSYQNTEEPRRPHISNRRLDLEDLLADDLNKSLLSNRAMSFVLIKSLLGKTSEPLLNKIKSLMRKGDKIYSIDDNSLLAVLPNASSNEAAGFVRQLRTKADKEILMKPLTALNSASFAFLSSVVTFPEDGHELQTVLGKAREALTTTRRLGVS